MTTTITGASPHTPTLLITYWWTRQSRTLIHPIPGAADGAVTLRPAGLRVGRAGAVFADKSAAMALEAELALAQTLTLADSDHSELDMTFVFDGQLELKLDPATRRNWILSWDYLEVS